MLKKIGFVAVFIVIGFLLGGFTVMAWSGYYMARGMLMLQESDISRVEDAAIKAYKTAPPEVGIWALEFYLDFIDEVSEQRMSAVKNENNQDNDGFLFFSPKNKWLSYVRLAILYEKTGNITSRDECMRKAIEISGLSGEDVEAKMIESVTMFDREHDAN